MTEPELKSFIAEIEHELDHGNSAYKIAELLGRALSVLREALPKGPVSSDFVHEVVGLYHKYFPNSPKVLTITPMRRSNVRQRCDSRKECESIEWWQKFFSYAAASDFLNGKRENDRGWRPDFDFFLQSKSFTRVQEGFYHKGQRDASLNDYLRVIQNEQARKK